MKCWWLDKLCGHTPAAPFTGAWIEIVKKVLIEHKHRAAPFTGAWIEMQLAYYQRLVAQAAPFTGAWIEIRVDLQVVAPQKTPPPSRGRGLK